MTSLERLAAAQELAELRAQVLRMLRRVDVLAVKVEAIGKGGQHA